MGYFIKDDSPLWQQIVKVAGFAIFTVVVFGFGFGWFGHEPQFTINSIYGTKEYSTDFYWRLHPLMWWDVLGIVLFEAGLIMITGIWSLVLGAKYPTKPTAYVWGSWVITVIGVILMMINPSTL